MKTCSLLERACDESTRVQQRTNTARFAIRRRSHAVVHFSVIRKLLPKDNQMTVFQLQLKQQAFLLLILSAFPLPKQIPCFAQ